MALDRMEYEQLTLAELEAEHWPSYDPDDRRCFYLTEDLDDLIEVVLDWSDNIDGPEARALTFAYQVELNLASDDPLARKAAKDRVAGASRDREVLVRGVRTALAIGDPDERELYLQAIDDAFADVETGSDFVYPDTCTEPDGFEVGAAVLPLKPIVRI